MDPSLPIFDTNTFRVVCVSDTHDDNPTASIPDGDVFIHAGDMVDRPATITQLTAVLEWVQKLPHKVKILIAGNGDVSLDKASTRFNPEALALFTSPETRGKGIHYLDREMRTVAYYRVPGSDEPKELRIYGNPLQPEFSSNRWPFTYLADSLSEAEEAWALAPTGADAVPIWVTHSPPLDRLDMANVAGFTGCGVLAQKIAAAKPRLCVFGHFHYSWGVERVKWLKEGHGIAEAQILSLSEERKKGEGLKGPETKTKFDFSDGGVDGKLTAGEETVYVNAGWMTWNKRKTEVRNTPIVVRITL
jgi:hypothetical protein